MPVTVPGEIVAGLAQMDPDATNDRDLRSLIAEAEAFIARKV